MTGTRCVALLRAINVGGTGRLPMAPLRQALTGAGFADVATYLQSGNVVLTAEGDPDETGPRIAAVIADGFGLSVPVLMRTQAQIAAIVARDPFAGRDIDPSRLFVAFLARDPGPDEYAAVTPGPGEEFASAGREAYLVCPDGVRDSLVTKTFGRTPSGRAATVRNWRTVQQVHALLGV